MTIKLCGFSASNYYNKIKLQLLEKGVAFEEELVWVGKGDEQLLGRSPMGKVPFLDTPQGQISESMACAEYVEAAYAQHPLLPSDPFAAGKIRELIVYLELHLELVARELYAEAFFGGKVSEQTKEQTRKLLVKGVAGFSRLAKFSPYVGGEEFSLADCSAVVHLPLVSSASKIIYGEDMLAGLPVKDYLRRLGERPAMQKVNEDRKANTEVMLAMRRGQRPA